MEHEGNSETNRNLSPWNGPEEPEKETEWTGYQMKNWDHHDYSTIKIG